MTSTLNSTDIYTIDEAAELLAVNDIREMETLRSAKDRTKKLIKYNINNGRLKEVSKGRIELGILIDWARQQKSFAGKLNEYPIKYIHISNGGIKVSGESDIHFKDPLPDSLNSCHKLISALKEEVINKNKEISKLKNEILKLKVLADKWNALALKNKKSALKPRNL